MLGWKLVRDRKIKAEPGDIFDAESELATEREITFMWLSDLNERVSELEDLTGLAPRMRQLALWNQERSAGKEAGDASHR